MSSNIFAALAGKKKKSSGKTEEKKDAAPKVDKAAVLEAAIFSAPSGNVASNWADEDSEDEFAPAVSAAAADDGWNEVRVWAMPNCIMAAAPAGRTCWPPVCSGQPRDRTARGGTHSLRSPPRSRQAPKGYAASGRAAQTFFGDAGQAPPAAQEEAEASESEEEVCFHPGAVVFRSITSCRRRAPPLGLDLRHARALPTCR
jgi:hypothetical protein